MLKRQRMSVKRLIRRYGIESTLRIISNKNFNITTGDNSSTVTSYTIYKVLKLTNLLYHRLAFEGVDLDFNKTTVILTKDELPLTFTKDLDHEFVFDEKIYHISQMTIFPNLEIVVFQLENLD
jgi:hypothetical protein